MKKKHNRNIILLFLVMITVVSLAFGYIYGREMNNVTMIDEKEFEGFGVFKEDQTLKNELRSDLKIKYTFQNTYVDPNEDSTKNKTITKEVVLKGVSSDVPLYQIRFPKNSIRFKPIYMKITFTGLDIDSLSKQGEISVSLYEHKDVKTVDDLSYPNYDYSKGYSGKKKKNPDMITMRNVFARKKIYSQTFCESKDSGGCGTNTNLKGDTYVIELNKNELPTNTEITDKHVIMIGGNSSIKYGTVEIDIIGDYEDVEQSFKYVYADLKLFANKNGWRRGASQIEIKPELIKFPSGGDIFIKKIRYKPGIQSKKVRHEGRCVNETHNIQFHFTITNWMLPNNEANKLGETKVKLHFGDNSVENKARNVYSVTCGGAIDDSLQPVKVIDVNKYIPKSLGKNPSIFIDTLFSNNNDVRSYSYPTLFELYYQCKRIDTNKNI